MGKNKIDIDLLIEGWKGDTIRTYVSAFTIPNPVNDPPLGDIGVHLHIIGDTYSFGWTLSFPDDTRKIYRLAAELPDFAFI